MSRFLLCLPLVLATPALAQTTEDCVEQLELFGSAGEPAETSSIEVLDGGFCEVTGYVKENFLGPQTADRLRWRISDGILNGIGSAGTIQVESIDVEMENFTGGLFASAAVMNLDFSMVWDATVGEATFNLSELVYEDDLMTIAITLDFAVDMPTGSSFYEGNDDEFYLRRAELTLAAEGDCSESNEGWAEQLERYSSDGTNLPEFIAGLPEASIDAESKAILTRIMTPLEPANTPQCPQPVSVSIGGNPIPLFGDWAAGTLPDPDRLAEVLDGVTIVIRDGAR